LRFERKSKPYLDNEQSNYGGLDETIRISRHYGDHCYGQEERKLWRKNDK
jgi:hypothetical protein